MTNTNTYPKSFEFKTVPYQHQLKVFDDSWQRKACGFFMEMGTGKTKVCIDTMVALYLAGEIKNVLIIAPKGVYENWSNIEIPNHMPEGIDPYIVVWKAAMKKSEQEKLDDIYLSKNAERLKILVMNVEALGWERAASRALSFAKYARDLMIIIDESTSIKNPAAKRTKVCMKLGTMAKYKRLASGLPTPNSPVDIFSQFMFLNREALPTQSIYAFRNRYCIMRDRIFGARRFKEIIGYQRMDELHSIIDKNGYRILKKDCLDLPDKIYLTRTVDMTADQQAAYDTLVRDTMMLVNAEQKKGLVSAPLMITRLLRLHQIVCGHVADDEGTVYHVKNNRIDAMLEVVEEMDGKVVIWANYRHDIRMIKTALEKEYPDQEVVTYYGETSQEDRNTGIAMFQNGPARFFVGNPQTGGFGITLTAASNVIYYSNNYSLEMRAQSEDRCHRIGQKNPVTYVDLITPNTVDQKIINALKNKETLAKTLLDQGAEFFRQAP